MPNRKRLLDFRTEGDPADVGLCLNDQVRCAKIVNTAQARLLKCREAGDEGWHGTWSVMALSVSRTAPYITTPRGVARLEKLNVCQSPVEIHNQFHEYLRFGNGNLPKTCSTDYGCKWDVRAYERNNAVTFTDLYPAPQYLRIYSTDTTGVDTAGGTDAKRVLIQGTDSNGDTLRSMDGTHQVQGVFATLASPFVDVKVDDVQVAFNTISGIQKDVTRATIQIFQVDTTTGEEVLLHIMDPGETVAGYRRYYLDNLPTNCCGYTTGTLQVLAVVKLDLVPVVADTDYLLIGNIEALMEECRAIHYGKADSMASKQMAQYHHVEAIKLLQGELVHMYGKEKPAMSFAPFGSFDPAHAGVGMI